MRNRIQVREKLWRANPFCCYCNRQTELARLVGHEKMKPLYASIEHKFQKGHPERGSRNSLTIACYECNTSKGSHDSKYLNSADTFKEEIQNPEWQKARRIRKQENSIARSVGVLVRDLDNFDRF